MIRPAGREVPVGRLVLIGFMGSGKSTVGRRLAELLGWDFVDFDEEIERMTGRSIPELFAEEGEPAFRALEAEITDAVAELEEVVLAPGGGWVTQPELVDALAPDSWIVWLSVSPEAAVERVEADDTRRPLLAGPDPLSKAKRLIRSREPFYRRAADAVVEVDGRAVDEVAYAIVDMLDDLARTATQDG